MYQELEITKRIKNLRNEYLKCPLITEYHPKYYSQDRCITLGFLEGWKANEKAVTTRLRRSLSEAAELDAMEPVILDDELVVGQLWFPKYTPEEQARFNLLNEQFAMATATEHNEPSRTRGDHICLDYEKLLKVGIVGLIEEINQKRAELYKKRTTDMYDFEQTEKDEFYECMLIELNAVMRLAKRYEEKARNLAETADEKRKKELLEIADNLAVVPMYPAQNFYQAVQSAHFFTFNLAALYPLGRPDRYLLPFYEQDIKNGTLTKEKAQDIIDNFCLLVSTYVPSRAAMGFIVGGRDKNKKLVENDLTYMFITALNHIKMPDPNGALACNRDTSRELIEYAVKVVGEGTTHPAFYNDDTIIEGLLSYGVDYSDACDYIHTTCAEISLCGKSRMYTTSTILALPNYLDTYITRNKPSTFEELLDGVFELVKGALDNETKRYHRRILEASRNGHQPQRVSALIDDCIKSGKCVYSGGARYSYLQPIFIGFGTFCDSLIAIKKLVFEQNMLTLEEFFKITEDNFKDNEELRNYIIEKLPHYGNDDDYSTKIARSITDKISDMFDNSDFFGKEFSIPGTFSYITHAGRGSGFKATYDGRLAGMSFSDGCCPVQGRDTNGPTALINSLTGWDQKRYLGGMVVNVKFSKSLFDSKKQNLLVSLISTFIDRKGIEMQINCVDKATLEDARIHPENHGDLIVRIGGFSDYFVRQSPAEQQELIDRSEY